ncbi:MAG: FecR domain-containing protein [Pseudomonadota bacterium]
MGEGEDLFRQIAAAGRRVDPRLSDRDVARLVAAARRRRERRAAMRRAVLAAGATGCLALIWVLAAHRVRHTPRVDADPIVRLSDGSTAAPLDTESQIDVVEDGANQVRLSLVRGRGRFQVVPRPQRTFLVRAGDVTVTVVGTVFTVERVADRVGVAVQRGTVHVDWKSGSAPVTAGQSGWFPPLVTAPDRPAAMPSVARGGPAPSAKVASQVTARDRRRGAAAELLLAADRARLSGHPDEGAELLRKLLHDHPRDPRVPLAAFTLGRLLLMELGRPAEAAIAFAEARRVAPAGPFAADALAREVEALSKAGMATDAQARAREYQNLYPNGRRTETIRTAGGIK